MMKILHTSDWHLGQKLYGYDRMEEQTDFLRQIAEIVKSQQPDVMVVSGDIFHSCNPSVEVQTLFVNALLDIQKACANMTIVLTAGNHDSYSRLEIDKNLWSLQQVHVVGNIVLREDRSADYDAHIFEVAPNGKPTGYVVAVPYCSPQNFPQVADDGEATDRQPYFFRQVLQRTNERNRDHLPVVLMAHLAITGSDMPGRDEMVGGMEYTNVEDMGEGYDYLALGHIHCPQTIRGSQGRARYSGSPIDTTFDERYPHSVTIVEIASQGALPEIQTIDIINPIPLVTIPEKDPALFDEALEQLQAFDPLRRVYVRLNVRVKADAFLSPDSMDKVQQAVKDKCCRFCLINRIAEDGDRFLGGIPGIGIDEIKNISTENILKIVQSVLPVSEDEMQMLQEVIDLVNEEDKDETNSTEA